MAVQVGTVRNPLQLGMGWSVQTLRSAGNIDNGQQIEQTGQCGKEHALFVYARETGLVDRPTVGWSAYQLGGFDLLGGVVNANGWCDQGLAKEPESMLAVVDDPNTTDKKAQNPEQCDTQSDDHGPALLADDPVP